MSQHGVTVARLSNASGIPQKNDVLNRVYVNVVARPVEDRLCPEYRVFHPDAAEVAVNNELYAVYRELYFALGQSTSGFGKVLPTSINIARRSIATSSKENG